MACSGINFLGGCEDMLNNLCEKYWRKMIENDVTVSKQEKLSHSNSSVTIKSLDVATVGRSGPAFESVPS